MVKISAKRKTLIETAMNLFCGYGFNATGIDVILKKANVSKMTLYKHFKTKDDLIIATLEEYHNNTIANIILEIDSLNISSKEKLIKIFDKFIELSKLGEIRCLYLGVLAEFTDRCSAVRKSAIMYKSKMEDYIKQLVKDFNPKQAKSISQLAITLLEGSLVMFQITQSDEYYKNAKEFLNTYIGLIPVNKVLN